LRERRSCQKESQQGRKNDAAGTHPASCKEPEFFHFHTLANELHRVWRMRGKSTLGRPPGVAAGTHWSRDTLGVPLYRPCPLRLDAAEQRKAVSRVNFPLSSYSVFLEKNVSQVK
jgi:hypothetical protein